VSFAQNHKRGNTQTIKLTNFKRVLWVHFVCAFSQAGRLLNSTAELDRLFTSAVKDASGKVTFDEFVHTVVAVVGFRAIAGVLVYLDRVETTPDLDRLIRK
jgi:hypothetical protein